MAEEPRIRAASRSPVDVHFVLLDDSLILDWAGPAEALRIANQCLRGRGLPPAFALHFVGPQAQTRSSVGAVVTGLEPLPDLAETTRPQWVVLVGQPGDRVALESEPARAMLHWLRGLRLAEGRVELMCICAGAVIAARAGLLARHKATTHHHPGRAAPGLTRDRGAGQPGVRARCAGVQQRRRDHRH